MRPVIGARGLLASGLLSESLGLDLHEEQRDLYEEQMEGYAFVENIDIVWVPEPGVVHAFGPQDKSKHPGKPVTEGAQDMSTWLF